MWWVEHGLTVEKNNKDKFRVKILKFFITEKISYYIFLFTNPPPQKKMNVHRFVILYYLLLIHQHYK